VTHFQEESIQAPHELRTSTPALFAAAPAGHREPKRRETMMHRRPAAPYTAETLTGIRMFQNVPRETLLALSKRCTWRWFEPHQAIVQHQDDGRQLFFVVQGNAREMHYSLNGREVTLRDLPAGQMFGELSVVDGQPQSATVIATVRTLIAGMPASVFWETVHQCDPFAAAILRRLAGLGRYMSTRVIELGTLSVRNRIHAELLRLSRISTTNPNTAIISPIPTHAQIASFISTHREAITRELNDLARAGLIEKQTGKLVIRDVAELMRMLSEVVGETHFHAQAGE
jgi:CRP/FNR family transcriptional regulator, cyclic AMP receptor protein